MPRYYLTDDSAAEQWAIKQAFQGLIAGEQECQHILCQWHFLETLKRRFGGDSKKKILAPLLSALRYRRSRLGCEQSIEEALEACQSEADRRYVQKECKDKMDMWAYCARTHSMALLQNLTTNAVESWHKTLKFSRKDQIAHYSLRGAAKQVAICAKDYDTRARKAELQFRTKLHPKVVEHPWLAKLPYPVQKLTAEELKLAERDLDDWTGERNDLVDELRCPSDCRFFRHYNLPCQHIWVNHLLFDTIRPEDQERWILMWEDSGFEVYEQHSLEYIEKEIDEDVFAPERHRLEMREALEGLKNRYFNLEESVQNLDPELQEQALKWWLGRFNNAVGEVWKATFEEFLRETGLQIPAAEQRPDP